MTPPPVAGVLLAAGLSRRMGRPKQLAPLAGAPLCRHAALALAGGGHTHLLAVIPPGEVGDGIRAALGDLPFAYAVNPHPERGLASSFRVAVQALPAGLAAANFALADMPLVTPQVHRALLDAFESSVRTQPPGVPLVLAQYGAGLDAVRAPPHLFRADLLAAVLDTPDADHGPRDLIRAHAGHGLVVRLPADLLLDVDTPEALEAAGAKYC